MKQIINTSLFLFCFICLNSCSHHCEDIIFREITQDEIDFISAIEGNTFRYINVKNPSEYYAKCIDKTITIRDSSTNYTEECDNYYSTTVFDQVTAVFTIDIPLYTSNINKFSLELDPYAMNTSYFIIILNNNYPEPATDYTRKSDRYLLYYSILTKRLYPQYLDLSVNYLDSTIIQNKVYKEVNVICDTTKYYDTIYYSKSGILKMVSIKNNLHLELVQ